MDIPLADSRKFCYPRLLVSDALVMLYRENKILQRADWDGKLQLKTEYKRLKAGQSIIRGEMKMAARTLVEV